jgi:hypothetical protein
MTLPKALVSAKNKEENIMSSVVLRTGYLTVPDYFVKEEAKESETYLQRLTRKRLNQAGHYKMQTMRKLNTPVQYQGVLFSFGK